MNIYERLISKENIYLAIYSLENSLQNRELVKEKELDKYRDIYNQDKINRLIADIKQRLEELIRDDDSYLKCNIYFKPKKIDENTNEVQFRPIHEYDKLLDCAAAIAMLNVLIYDFGNICSNCVNTQCAQRKEAQCDQGKEAAEPSGAGEARCRQIQLSNIINLIPGNFYGNRISLDPARIYEPWQQQYREYTSTASELFLKYHMTKEYSYEVDIDIVDFFPSINPRYIISFIMDKLPVYITNKNRMYIRKILTKLLYVEVLNGFALEKEQNIWLEYYKRYDDKNALVREERYFTVGVAQGLVQSYFFANIFMILVSQVYDKKFQGEALYYVDDSVIFTNKLEESEFNAQIKSIEDEINRLVEHRVKAYRESKSAHHNFSKHLSYQIELHKDDDKSSYTNVLESKTGEVYLTNVCRTVSQAAVEISNSLSDNEDVTLRSRLKKLSEEIEKEINYISNNERFKDDPTVESYKKKLKRYLKFFKYRGLILQYREELSFENIFEPLIREFISIKDEKNETKEFIDNFNEDIFMAAISFSIKIAEKACDKESSQNQVLKIKRYVKDIDAKLFGFRNRKCSYLYRVMQNMDAGKKAMSRFESLEKRVAKKYPDYKYAHDKVREDAINEIFAGNFENELRGVFTDDFNETISYVYENSHAIKKDLLNCVVSNVYNIVVDDSYNFAKKENRMLTYKEIRMLTYIRNYRFDMNKFSAKIPEILSENTEKIDYSLLEVLKCFRLFVKDPDRIDDLIKVHQYTCDVWKNGSKHLYFYTLHNQEHAVLLIKNVVELVKSIHFIKISRMDYYILFIACYLHDISMVTIPNLGIFNDNNLDANSISTKYLLDVERYSNDSRVIKNLLIRYYKYLDEYYEEQVRSKHADKSGQEIRKRKDLDFLDTFVREVVAQVAEAHGYGADEVYKAKSVASDMMYSKKFMQIILRLADLLDISSYRISKPMLNNNIDNMSAQSSFHWISHIATERYQIKVSYYDDGTQEEPVRKKDGEAHENSISFEKEFKSYLTPKRIIEKIDIEIYMNVSQFTEVEKLQCKNMRLEYDKSQNCRFTLKCGEACDAKSCNFICKWVAKKNAYLFEELKELKRYLNDNERNFFLADINVCVITDNKVKLSPREFDIVNKELNT